MAFPVITALYAGLLGLLLIALSIGVSRQRMRHKVSLGDGGVRELSTAIRAQGNFIEYVPMALLLILLLELAGNPGWMIHTLGGALFLGRILHAHGINKPPREGSLTRRGGTVLTYLVLLIGGILLTGSAAYMLMGA